MAHKESALCAALPQKRRSARPPNLNLPQCHTVNFRPIANPMRIEEEIASEGMWSVCARRGRRRSKREDMYTVDPFITTDVLGNPVSLFAVFDGHGGERAARFASVRISELLVQAVKAGEFLPQALEDAFITTDRELNDADSALLESLHIVPPSPRISCSTPRLVESENSGNLSPVEGMLRRSSSGSGSAFGTVALQSSEIPRTPTGGSLSRLSEDRCLAAPIMGGRTGATLNRKRSKLRADEQLSSVAVPAEQGSGTTATVVALAGDELFVAHVGDTRAVVCNSDGTVRRLCEDHRPDRKDEMERIEAAGGIVVKVHGTFRVNGVLAVTRALGDANMKDSVIAKPDVSTVCLAGDEEFMIIATDGLWDVMSDEEVIEMIRESLKTDDTHILDDHFERNAVKVLIDSAWDRGSNDDVCVLVINLLKYRRKCKGEGDLSFTGKTPRSLPYNVEEEGDLSMEMMTPYDDGELVTQRRRGGQPW